MVGLSQLSKFADDTKFGGKVDIRKGSDYFQASSITLCIVLITTSEEVLKKSSRWSPHLPLRGISIGFID